MKTLLRKFARRLAHYPVIGRFVRIFVAVVRLPENQNELLHFKEYLQADILPALKQSRSIIEHKICDNKKLLNAIDETVNKKIAALQAKIGQIDTQQQEFIEMNQKLLANDNHLKAEQVKLNQLIHGLQDEVTQLSTSQIMALQQQITHLEHRSNESEAQFTSEKSSLYEAIQGLQQQLNIRDEEHEAERVSLVESIQAVQQKVAEFAALQQQFSELEQRQLASDNLAKSAPIVLRNMNQALKQLQKHQNELLLVNKDFSSSNQDAEYKEFSDHQKQVSYHE